MLYFKNMPNSIFWKFWLTSQASIFLTGIFPNSPEFACVFDLATMHMERKPQQEVEAQTFKQTNNNDSNTPSHTQLSPTPTVRILKPKVVAHTILLKRFRNWWVDSTVNCVALLLVVFTHTDTHTTHKQFNMHSA